MLKYCSFCGQDKDAEQDFPLNGSEKCWDCYYQSAIERPLPRYWKESINPHADPKAQYIAAAKRNIERDRLQKEQKDRCAICDMHAAENGKGLALDHDHETDAIRGLLCNKCNLLIGMADDNPALLRAAAEYLEKHKARSENEQTLPASPLPSS